ncbi:hypothetical protein P152DRAFT_516289 [Eremomyces bilateralis CBS 781.70]|uniref:Zn(2)-C6 fungal-type domain-containing protein n=1 Tax=Eremomyces bilateralis CBS 781.70 TaxID=1392243 RepID=A0A6G1FW09_9PEZI|nr:uncharacterized protein P152DRAFT_516289 [Eremomyces bilateralis CBS 781.70]KAF1809861.1 hypothetical protein P152DRAFT_516289 [Eremomyces bilateralis CBS 781.70]
MMKARTRVLTKGQSSGGCVTCKSRKVKCDEIKPQCLRCFQSRIQCGGYSPKGMLPGDNNINTSGAVLAASSQDPNNSTAFKAHLDPALLSHIGLNSLLEFDDAFCPVGQKAWKHVLERYANASPGAKAACIVYGAAKELQVLSHDVLSHLEDIYSQYYGSAVSLLRNDVEDLATRLPSVFTTCLVLCSVELLFRRRQNALKHINAVFQMVYTECHFLSSPSTDTNPYPDAMKLHPEIASDFHLLLHVIDIQILSYTNGTRLASMEVCPLDALERYILAQDVDLLAEGDIIHVIHASYAFVAETARNAAGTSAGKLVQDKNRLLNMLQQGNSLLDSLLLDKASLPRYTSRRILRSFCLALSALLANLFCLYEEAWTLESMKFEHIITSAEELLASSNLESRSTRGRQEIRFVPQLGIIPPLYLAALKHRNSAWRRRAINCLRQAGIEGPWNGAMSAALAERCMEIEESTPDQIPSEKSMVSLCFAMDDNGENDGRLWPSSAYGSTTMKIIRRLQPAAVVDALLPSSAHFKALSVDARHSLDPKVWEHWQKRIEFGPTGYILG